METTEVQPAVSTEVQPAVTSEVKNETPDYFTLPLPDGSSQNVTSKELISLAQFGATKLQEQRNKPVEDEELDTEGKVSKLERELQELRDSAKNDKELQAINSTLLVANSKSTVLKERPKLAAVVNTVALAQYNQNPRISLDQWHDKTAQVINDLVNEAVETEKTKIKNTGKISAITNSTNRSSGNPILDKTKEFKADDVRTGASRKAFASFLEQLET
mgnify:CR=1 FL=1